MARLPLLTLLQRESWRAPGRAEAAVDADFRQLLDPGIADEVPELADELLDLQEDLESCAARGTCTELTVPLAFRQGALEIRYGVGNNIDPGFRAILDTGSPFLSVPGGCSRYFGCFDSTRSGRGDPATDAKLSSAPSGLEDTVEQFVGGEGAVEWRTGPITMIDARGCLRGLRTTCPPRRRDGLQWPAAARKEDGGIVFAVFDQNLVDSRMSGGGGTFFGLVKYTADRIRPSFLGQTNVVAFRIRLDTRRSEPDLSLTLSSQPLIPKVSRRRALPLYDLRPVGDTVFHYATAIAQLRIDDVVVPLRRPTFVIFDSGTTGCLLSDGIVEAYRAALKRPSGGRPLPNGDRPGEDAGADVTSELLRDVARVQVLSECLDGNLVAMEASRASARSLFVVSSFRGLRASGVEVVALGLAFMANNDLYIDIDDRLALLERVGTI